MDQIRIYLLVFLITAASSNCSKPALPDLRESYSRTETKPFGGRMAFDILQNSFPENYIQADKQRFENSMANSPDSSSLYFCLANNFFTTVSEADLILDFVYKGNTFFLSSANIDSLLLNKIYCKIESAESGRFGVPLYSNTSVTIIEDANFASDSFKYFYWPFSSYFSLINDNYGRALGRNADDKINSVVFFWGKGKLILHTDPRAFSNYFLLTNKNYLYMSGLLQLFDESPGHIYWSDYYWRQTYRTSNKSFSTLSEIFKQPALRTAFWISLFLLCLYLVFGSKRKQRIIRQILPNENSSVIFTETIARLYFQKKDNKSIADKMITYFNEYLRTKFFIHGSTSGSDFVQALSKKSGVSLDKTTSLYHAIEHANRSNVLDDYQLLSLNNQLAEFYKNRK